jgi:hypothetical protein
MAKLAYLLALPLLAALGCAKNNPAYCNDPTHVAEFCPDAMVGPQGCQSNAECTADPKASICDVPNRKCVACDANGQSATCDSATPICEAHACRICKAHSDCDSRACLPNGTCAAATAIAYVSEADSADNPTCDQATPCETIQHAIDVGRAYVKINGKFDEGVSIRRSLTILADPGAELTRGANGPVLVVDGLFTVEINDLTVKRSRNDVGVSTVNNATLTLNHVTVSEMMGSGISCAGKQMTINQSTIYKNMQLGVICSNGALKITSSLIGKNNGGGISLTNSTLDITNTFIVHNGADNSTVGGASLNPTGTGNRFEFNTVADNRMGNTSTFSGGLFCDSATLSAANNIIAHNYVQNDTARTNANLSPGCTSASTAGGSTLDALKLVNSSNEPYDYHLQAGSSAIGAATTASLVTTDFEGDPRPDGAKDQGADQYKAP